MFKSLTIFSVTIFLFCLNARSNQSLENDELRAMVEAALNEATSQEQETLPALTLRVENTQAVPASLNFQPIPENFFEYAKFNDLKNVRDYDSNANKPFSINGSSNRILVNISENPARFTGVEGLRLFIERDDLAPTGYPEEDSDGKKIFKITNSRADRRRNVIFSVYYEDIREVSATKYPESGSIQDVYQADLLIFAHQDRLGGFFTRVKVELDWSDLAGDDKGYVKVISEPDFISLSETDFEVYVDLGKQKTVLFDKSEHNIRIVFAITSGGFDNRSSVDGVVGSLSLQMPRNLITQDQLAQDPELEYQDFNNDTAFLVKRSRWNNNRVNTETRVAPYFFNGRPFISIIDTRFVTRDESGNLASNLHGGYRLVGFHDKIEKNGLIRAPYSNGCLRTPDPDLYALDALINLGPKDMIPLSARMTQPKFAEFEPVIPRRNLYRQSILQVRDESPNNARTVNCGPTTANYTVKYYQGRDGRTYQTMVSTACLTGMDKIGQSSDNIVEYIIDKRTNGRASFQPPATSIASRNALHPSIQKRHDALMQNYNVIPMLRPQHQGINAVDQYISDYSLRAQNDKINLIGEMQQGIAMTQHAPRVPEMYLTGNKFPQLTSAHFHWQANAALITTRGNSVNDSDVFSRNIPWYNSNCSGKVRALANRKCRAVFNTINAAGTRVNRAIPSTLRGS